MKLSTETYVMRKRFGDMKAIEMIKKAGFDCYDYSMYWTDNNDDMLGEDYREKAYALKAYADKLGICCNQAHAPFEFNSKSDTMDITNAAYKRLIRSIEVASVLGAKTIIVHAICDMPNDEFFDYNRTFYNSLITWCKKYKIEVSVENLFKPKDGNWEKNEWEGILSEPGEHMDFVKSLGEDCFNICVDVGHLAITGNKPDEVISAMDSRLLKSLHIHDNDYSADLHYMPYFGSFDWDKIIASLKKIGYNNELTFEIFGSLSKLDDELLQPALDFAEKIGRNLIKK